MKESFSFWSRALGVGASLLSLLLFFWNAAANVWAVVSFYQEQKYFSMGLLIFLILSSSMLLQFFSWLWYTESSERIDSSVEKFMKGRLLDLVHVLQLGVFFRCLCMLKISVSICEQEHTVQASRVRSLRSDLSTLYLFKAFIESAPQLILMLTNIIQVQDLQLFTVIKIISSLSSLSFTVLSYHRSMSSLLPDKSKMGWSSSIIFFLWNLFLIGPRVVCMSFFASALPCYVAAHVLSLWALLVLWAWWQETDFMNSKAGEWLYRATVGLIWYFSWFNVKRKDKNDGSGREILYQVVIGADTMLLLGLWWWWRSVESARLSPLPVHPYLLIAMLVIIYIIGVLLEWVYYWKFHSKQPDLEIDEEDKIKPQAQRYDTVDSRVEPRTEPKSALITSSLNQRTLSGSQKRMRRTAENFFC